MVTQVLFLRHFPTQLNIEKRISGRSIDIPVLQTDRIGCDLRVDSVLCSPALRCRQTLDAFLQDHAPGDVRYLPELLERSMGEMEGCLRREMVLKYPQLFDGQKFRLAQTPPGGESFDAFQARVRSFWERYREELGGTLLVCSHNQFLKMLCFIIREEPVTQAKWRELQFPCGTIQRII